MQYILAVVLAIWPILSSILCDMILVTGIQIILCNVCLKLLTSLIILWKPFKRLQLCVAKTIYDSIIFKFEQEVILKPNKRTYSHNSLCISLHTVYHICKICSGQVPGLTNKFPFDSLIPWIVENVTQTIPNKDQRVETRRLLVKTLI